MVKFNAAFNRISKTVLHSWRYFVIFPSNLFLNQTGTNNAYWGLLADVFGGLPFNFLNVQDPFTRRMNNHNAFYHLRGLEQQQKPVL